MNNQFEIPSISTDDIIIKITGQDMIEMGWLIEENPQDKYNLIISVLTQQIAIAPDVDGAEFDLCYEFDYEETLSELHELGHLPAEICAGLKYWYNNDIEQTSGLCNSCDIAEICGLSQNELNCFDSLESLNSFMCSTFSFSFSPKY